MIIISIGESEGGRVSETKRPFIEVEQVSKSFADQNDRLQVLANISFTIAKGEIISILGESGCGKSTLLNIIAGFEKADHGQVIIDQRPVQKPSRNGIMLFQDYALLPWRSVLKNVELGLEGLPLRTDERREKALHYLELVGLQGKEHLFPHQLSGGMQQRVGIARALTMQPELILMDEPFAALDTFNRYYLQDELLRIQQQEKTTILLVTHDIDEAIYLSDRILIMQPNPGRVHKILDIVLAKPRDRSHSDFQYYRKLIFEEFHFQKQLPSYDYTI